MPAQGRPSWRAPPPIPPARQFGGRDPHHETVAVLGQKMPEVGEPGFLAVALAEEPRITVGCRGVAIVPTRLAFRPPPPLLTAFSSWPEALHRRPGLDLSAVDREVLI